MNSFVHYLRKHVFVRSLGETHELVETVSEVLLVVTDLLLFLFCQRLFLQLELLITFGPGFVLLGEFIDQGFALIAVHEITQDRDKAVELSFCVHDLKLEVGKFTFLAHA